MAEENKKFTKRRGRLFFSAQKALLPTAHSVEGHRFAPVFAGLDRWVRILLVGQPEEVIRLYMVEGRKFNQNIGRNIQVAALVVAVNALGAVQDFTHFSLRQIPILA